MFIAKNSMGYEICARCGKYVKLTKDHFIPKSCRMTVNRDGNYVGLCVDCNREKADKIVLNIYMRYCRSWIRCNTSDSEVIEYIEKL